MERLRTIARLRTTARTGIIWAGLLRAPVLNRWHILGRVAGPTRLVLQLHDATTLHFDFRL
jgi:hypothetical protein